MQSRLNAYLSFRDNAREAMEFYQSVLDGKLTVSTFKDLQASQNPAEDDMVMHAMLEADNGMVLMGSDTPSRMEYQPGTNFSLSLSGDNDAELTGYFNKLADGGQVTMPLDKAPWGDKFGMCTDKFGINWLVNISPAT